MNSVLSTGQSLMQMFNDRAKEFSRDEIDNVHMVWLKEITQEANRMFSKEFNTEPELMPKTPSQKKKTRRKRVSVGRQEENQARRRFSKGRRSNLRGSGSVKSLNFIEEETIPEASTSDAESSTKPKRATRKNKQTESEVAEDVSQGLHGSCDTAEMQDETPEPAEEEAMDINNKENNEEVQPEDTCSAAQSPPKIPLPELVVSISSSDRLSAELAKRPEPSPGRTAAKIAIAGAAQSSRRSSMRCSLKLRHSLGGLRHSMTRESMRRTSRRSMLKKKMTQASNSTCSSEEDSSIESVEEEERAVTPEVVTADTEDNDADKESQEIPETQFKQPALLSIGRVTRSVAAASPKLALPALNIAEKTMSTPIKNAVFAEKQQTARSGRRSRQSTKRKAAETVEQSPTRRCSPPKKPQSAIRPSMKSFLHTVQKNQMLMMTPSSLGRSGVIKSFIKHTTPLKYDPKTKERQKLEALKRKQELEEERMKKMDEEKKKKQDELKRKRDERLRRVYEAKVKEEQKEEEKKKKIEQKMAQTESDKRVAEEQAKKKVAGKRQEDLEQKKKLEEESKRKRIQQAEEEKRQQEFLAKKKVEEEEQRARKQAEIRRAQELERERERMAAIERERVEREKALALQREVERAAREKERREIEERRKALEEKRRNEEQQRVAEQKAARERQAAKLREAAAAAAAAAAATAAAATAAAKQAADVQRSVMKTPVGKGGGLNVTVDIEQSPQSYSITPKGGNKPLIPSKSADDYGMDQNSDDSTDDESAPRKPIPSWAQAHNLQQMMMKQYFNPPDLYSFFGKIEPPKLENIFYKSKPRYFKRTSSAVWHSPPIGSK